MWSYTLKYKICCGNDHEPTSYWVWYALGNVVYLNKVVEAGNQDD